jgi:hypothetical protein
MLRLHCIVVVVVVVIVVTAAAVLLLKFCYTVISSLGSVLHPFYLPQHIEYKNPKNKLLSRSFYI